jgi:hypothetical protein
MWGANRKPAATVVQGELRNRSTGVDTFVTFDGAGRPPNRGKSQGVKEIEALTT